MAKHGAWIIVFEKNLIKWVTANASSFLILLHLGVHYNLATIFHILDVEAFNRTRTSSAILL